MDRSGYFPARGGGGFVAGGGGVSGKFERAPTFGRGRLGFFWSLGSGLVSRASAEGDPACPNPGVEGFWFEAPSAEALGGGGA